MTEAPNALNIVKLTDWEKEPSVNDLRGDLEESSSSHSGLVNKLNRWQDLMNVTGSAKPKPMPNRSAIQPKLIRRQAEWRYAALSEPLLSSSKLFTVHPVTFEDKESAVQNELVLNWQFRTKLNRVKFIDEYVRSCVDEGTVIVRVGWERITEKVIEQVPTWAHYLIETQEQMDTLESALELKQRNPRMYLEQVPEDVKAAVDYYINTEQATIAIQTGVVPTTVEKVITNRPDLEILNPRNVRIDPTCNGNLDKAMFAIVSFETNQAELRKTGKYKNLDAVDWENVTIISDSNHESPSPIEFNHKDAMRKKIVAYEYFGYYDINNNQTLVPIVATWVGGVMIRLEESPFPDKKIPLVLVPYSPVKRQLHGEPDAELLEDNQRVLGAVMRGAIDLLGKSANGQQGFVKGMLDPLNRRRFDKGEDYEFNPVANVAQGIVEHKYPEIPQSAMLMLNLQNQEAESMSGVKAFSGGISGNGYGDVATGIRGALDATAKREMSILRRLAKGLSEIATKILAMNAVFLSEEEVVRVTNSEFITVKREDLAGNFDLDVDISTAEIDNAKAQDLGFMLQTIGPNEDPIVRRMILEEITKLKRMPELADKLKNYQPEPSPLEQLEMQKVQLEIQEIESRIALNQAQTKLKTSEADSKDLDFVEKQSGVEHNRAMEHTQAQAQANKELEVIKALLQPKKPEETKPDIDTALGLIAMTE